MVATESMCDDETVCALTGDAEVIDAEFASGGLKNLCEHSV